MRFGIDFGTTRTVVAVAYSCYRSPLASLAALNACLGGSRHTVSAPS
jgi:molecular chaperone DnaK (HSP70)